MKSVELIARARERNTVLCDALIEELVESLETSEKALAEAKADASYAYAELAKLRHELVTYKRDTKTAVEAVLAYQDTRAAFDEAVEADKQPLNYLEICAAFEGAQERLVSLELSKGTP